MFMFGIIWVKKKEEKTIRLNRAGDACCDGTSNLRDIYVHSQ